MPTADGIANSGKDMRASAILIAWIVLGSTGVGLAQGAGKYPRGRDGHPDFQGNWESRWVTPLERMRGAKTVNVDAGEARDLLASYFEGMARRPGNANPDSDMDLIGLAPADGAFRTSLVIQPDTGKIPFNPDALAIIDRLFSTEGLDNPEERDASERCIAGGGRAPMLAPPSNGYMQIVQTSAYLVLLSEGLGDLRILSPGGITPDPRITSPHGQSVSHWEGDVLVVETTGFRADDQIRIAPPQGLLVLSPRSAITERFIPISDNEFRYQFTVSDPELYTSSWIAETTWIRTKSPLFEYACHEANYSLTNILLGGRYADRVKSQN